jgi:Ca2+-transporting ATPase
MFNAKAFMTGRSTFASLRKCSGFLAIAAVILGGQWLIVTIGGTMFNVMPLAGSDWGIIIGVTSVVLWVGEARRGLKTIAKSR